MKKALSAIAATALLSVAGLASASEPLQLSDNQMDTVSAGSTSVAAGLATAVWGTTISNSSAGTLVVITPIAVAAATHANSFNLATGYYVLASSAAAASL